MITGEVIIGSNCVIKSNTTIGSEGFGFAYNNNKHIHFPHTGGIKIGKRVWIGSNVSIEKGSLENTIISDGVLIDDLVQIGHNVKIGNNCILAGQVGIAGSSIIGNNVMIGGQAGISGHLNIGNNVKIGGGSGVVNDIPNNHQVMGYPAVSLKEFVKQRKK